MIALFFRRKGESPMGHTTGRSALAIILFLVAVLPVSALDIEAIDKVSVLMPKSKVVAIMGQPDATEDVVPGLKAEMYRLTDTGPMKGAGCLYDENQNLAGQVFIFEGNVAHEAAERIKKNGFTLDQESKKALRLSGRDDDTGQPIVVVILEEHGLTSIMTFEKGFYDRQTK
jgi:hypothetical protein